MKQPPLSIDISNLTMYVVSMTITATEFKAKCLQLMDRVLRTNEPIVILKRGKEVARLVPPLPKKKAWQELSGTVEVSADIVSPHLDESEFDAATGKEIAHGRTH